MNVSPTYRWHSLGPGAQANTEIRFAIRVEMLSGYICIKSKTLNHGRVIRLSLLSVSNFYEYVRNSRYPIS
jgi:hypothetical protein